MIRFEDRFLLATCPPAWRDALAERGLPLPDRDRAAKAWVWDDDAVESIRFLHEAYHVPLDEDAKDRIGSIDVPQRLRDALKLLRPYQRDGVAFLSDRRRAMLADGMGLGKTVQALMAMETIGKFPVVVLCPASVKFGWQAEVVRWVPWRSVQVLWSGKDKIHDVDIIVLNPELLPRQIEDLCRQYPQVVVMDEAHQYKNPNAQRTQMVEELMRGVPNRFALTGTPIPNRRPDLLQQLQLLGQLEEVLGIYRGVLPHYWQPGQKLRHEHAMRALETLPRREVHGRLKATCFLRRTKDQVHEELPAFHRTRRELRLPDASPYLAREQSFIEWVRANRTGEQWTPQARLQGRAQLSVLRREAALAKIPAIVEWAQGLDGERAIYFCHHKQVAHALQRALPGNVALITGDVDPKQRQRLIHDLSDYAGLVATMDSSGQGVDGMQLHARHVVFVELDWTPTKHEQCEGRLHRIGQKERVEAWYFTARETIDDAMMRRLDQKWADVQGILEGDDDVEQFVASVMDRAARGIRGEALWHGAI